jgi:hypothetical protein
MRRLIFPPSTLVKVPNIFGDGSDGNVTLSSNLVMDRDYFFNNLIIPSNRKIDTNGFRLFVKNILVNRGLIYSDGKDAVGVVPGLGANFGSIGGGSIGGDSSGPYLVDRQGADLPLALGGQGGSGGDGGGTGGSTGGALGSIPAAGGLNRDLFNLLVGRVLPHSMAQVYHRAYKTSNQSVTQSANTAITFPASQISSSYNIYHPANTSRFYLRKSGDYLVSYRVSWQISGFGDYWSFLRLNGSDVVASGVFSRPTAGGYLSQCASVIVSSATDNSYLELFAWQGTTGSQSIFGSASGNFATSIEIISLSSGMTILAGGSGGGAGGRSTSDQLGGGGGGGGGVVLIGANILDNSQGVIRAKGGKGGNVSTDAGGGGGGGGGAIILISNVLSEGTLDVSGGAGGTSTGGSAGATGNAGQVFKLQPA